MATTNMRFADMVEAVCEVDNQTWLKCCLGIGATTLVVRLATAHLERKAYWRRIGERKVSLAERRKTLEEPPCQPWSTSQGWVLHGGRDLSPYSWHGQRG